MSRSSGKCSPDAEIEFNTSYEKFTEGMFLVKATNATDAIAALMTDDVNLRNIANAASNPSAWSLPNIFIGVTIGRAILQFTDVARPAITLQKLDLRVAQLRPGKFQTAAGEGDEVFRQQPYVFAALAQRRNRDGKDGQPVIQIFSEATGGDLTFEVAVGRCDQAHIHAPRALFADALELALLQHAQQFALQLERDLANFIQKQRPAVGQLKASGAVAHGAGERAFDVTEEFALEQFARDRSAIDLDERAVATPAAFVNGAGDEFLARARLALDKYGRFGRRDLMELHQRLVERGAAADDFAEGQLLRDLFAQVGVLQLQLFAQPVDLLEGASVGHGDGGLIGESAQPAEFIG
jgi:hypothetical protein